MKPTATVPVEILLAEDNAADVRLTREALKRAKVLNVLHHVEDGMEAMDFLLRKGKYADAPRPHLILLDLNMPKMGGHEVLAAVKADPSLQAIPVVVLTTSKAEEDIVQSYQLHANAYMSKPVDLDRFLSVIRSFEEFWLTVVTLPPTVK
jgi:CheY-like chemotaxis protein